MADRTTARRFDEIYAFLLQRLSPHRVLHSLGTAHTAVRLAALHGADPEAALLAALLHDMAKEHDHAVLLARIERHLSEMDPDDRDFPSIWHAIAGEILAYEEFNVLSPEIGAAIRTHPTGNAEMNQLEQIIFLSDYIEPTRGSYRHANELRRLAREDLGTAVDAAILAKTEFLTKRGRRLHARSLSARRAAQSRSQGAAVPAEGKKED